MVALRPAHRGAGRLRSTSPKARPLSKHYAASAFEAPVEAVSAPARALTFGEADVRALARHCMRYRDPIDRRAWFELVVTLALYLPLCAVLLWAAATGLWGALALALPAGLLLVRLFTVQHDCGHGSFFSSRRLNDGVGRALSVLTFTPYGFWKRTHALHHGSAGDLGRRGVGDVDTYTVDEFANLTPWARRLYRLYRHPLVLHVVGPPLYFMGLQRSPWGQALPSQQAWRSIAALNAALVAFYGALALWLGLGTVAPALLPVACVASWVGAWLFFVQHQFEHTHWAQPDDWHMQTAALHGSSHYVLPGWLNWLTGNIALHHIHHLNSRVPSYRLADCLRGDGRLGMVSRLGVRESLGCIGLSLWDERARRLVSFAEAARGRRVAS